jgi:hypothetical protein
MARIADTRGRTDENSGYSRLLGNQELGKLISMLHATVIRTGNELERVLQANTPVEMITSISNAIGVQGELFPTPIQVVFSPRMVGVPGVPGVTGDIAIFDHEKREAKVIEVKDGDTFDTKKASGELASMKQFAEWLTDRTGYEVSIYFCSFNQESKDAIVRGAKGRFSLDNAMTGRELCSLLRIDYDALRLARQSEQVENLDFFLTSLLAIPDIRKRISELSLGKSTEETISE